MSKLKMPSKNICPECTTHRQPKRGILAINCIVEKDSEWFCGYPCMIDFFNKIDGKALSQTTQLLNSIGFELIPEKPIKLFSEGDEEE